MYYSKTYQLVFSKYLSYVSTTYILNSTVFSVKNNELIIFGKTLDNVKEKAANFLGALKKYGLFSKKGAFASLFHNDKQKNLSYPELFTQFDQFKEKFNSSTLSAEALAEQMGNVDSSIVHYAKTCKNGEMITSGFKESINSLSLSAKAGKLALHALSMAGNIAVSIGISKLIEGIYHLTQVSKHVAQKAQEVGSSFSSTSSSINDYKTKILELSNTIHDSRSSIQEMTNAHKSLLDIQDELIAKFGQEEEAVHHITNAIQGLANDFNFNNNFANHLTKLANAAREVSDQYKEFWNQYILQEKILKNPSSDSYKNYFFDIMHAAEEYNLSSVNQDEEYNKRENVYI